MAERLSTADIVVRSSTRVLFNRGAKEGMNGFDRSQLASVAAQTISALNDPDTDVQRAGWIEAKSILERARMQIKKRRLPKTIRRRKMQRG